MSCDHAWTPTNHISWNMSCDHALTATNHIPGIMSCDHALTATNHIPGIISCDHALTATNHIPWITSCDHAIANPSHGTLSTLVCSWFKKAIKICEHFACVLLSSHQLSLFPFSKDCICANPKLCCLDSFLVITWPRSDKPWGGRLVFLAQLEAGIRKFPKINGLWSCPNFWGI